MGTRFTVLPQFMLAIVVTACASKPATIDVPEEVWQQDFEHAVRFHSLLADRLLVVGTERHLYGLDPADGKTLWRERNVNARRQDVYGVAGAPYVLVNDLAGGRFDDSDTHVLAIARRDGQLLWESAPLPGAVVHAALEADKRRLIVVTVAEAHGDDRGFLSGPLTGKGLRSGVRREPELAAVDLSSGALLWQRPFGRAVRMRPVAEVDHHSGDGLRPFDMGGYHPPIVVDGLVCVTYAGVHCYRTATGEPVWHRRFPVIEDELALAYAEPLVIGNQLLTTGDNRAHSMDLQTGKRLWRSARSDYLPDLVADRDTVFAQLGGRFFELDRERWLWRGEFGVLALDRHTGDTLWRYDDAKGSITNPMRRNDQIWIADRKRLMAFAADSGAVLREVRHGLRDAPVFTVQNAAGSSC